MSAEQSEAVASVPSPNQPSQNRRNPLRRLGCLVLLPIWCFVMLTPCFLIVLASQQEIAIQTGDLPGQSLRIWLVNEPNERGIGVSRPTIYRTNEDNACLQTDVSFLLWAGSQTSSTYCECFTGSNAQNLELISSAAGTCNSR